MFEEKTINDEIIFKGRTIELHRIDVELPNKQTSVREIIKTKDSVAIIALTKENEILLVKQYRKACEQVLYEIPAGRMDGNELPVESARRELLEETGYGNGVITLINKVLPSVGTSSTTQYIYLFEKLELLHEKLSLDEDEFLELVKVPLNKFQQMYESGEILDMKTVLAYFYLRDRI